MQKDQNNLEHLNKDNSFSFNNYFLNIKDNFLSIIVNIISPEEENSKCLNTIKSPIDTKNIYNKNKLSNKVNDKVNKNKTYNRNNNKLYKYFIKKEKRESIHKLKRDRLFNINTINTSELKQNNNSMNNKIKITFNNKKIIKEIEKNNINNTKNYNNNKYNIYSKNHNNKIMSTSLNYKNIGNLNMSEKIHFYVQNILEKIPNAQNNRNIRNKSKNEDNEKSENISFNNKYLGSGYILNKNRKNHSQNILIGNNKAIYNKNTNNRITFNNYIISLKNNKNIIKNNEKYNKNKYPNSNYYIEENKKSNISNKSNFSFQKILFNKLNTKFKNLLISFLDQKSIIILSSINKTFHKNLRNLFFNNISKLLLSENKDIFIKKIIRSIFKYSSFKSKNKSEFKIFYESMNYPNKIYTDNINNDLLRTFPKDPNFKEGNKYYIKLFHLLTCYANYNKNIGYAQGLNFLFANAIYLFSTEEDIFLFIDGFINFLQLENVLGINNQKKLPEKINDISNILEKYIPNIIKVFNEKFVKIEIFLTNWILTIFSCSMNRKNLIISWCFLILFGWKFFYCFIIQILIQYQNMIFNLNEIKLCNKMKNILQSDEFNQDFDIIINKTIDFMKDHIIL